MIKLHMKRFRMILILAFTFSALQTFADIHQKPIIDSVKVQYLGTKSVSELNGHSPPLPPFKIPHMELQAHASLKSMANPYAPFNIGLNFIAANQRTDMRFTIPLNINGAVGREQYILMIYQTFRSFNKKTGLPDGILETDSFSFFGDQANDIRFEYDHFSHRWYASCEIQTNVLDSSTSLDIVLAVSSEDPIKLNTPWSFFKVRFAEICPQCCLDSIYPPPRPYPYNASDYQQLAIDRNAVYIAVDVQGRGGSLLIFEKKSLLEGHPQLTVISGINPSPTFEYNTPADNFDNNPKYIYLVHTPSSPLGFATTFPSNILLLYRVVNPIGKCTKLVGPIYIQVPTYAWPQRVPHKGNVYREYGYLQNSGQVWAPHVRDNQLYLCHVSQLDAAGNGTPEGDRTGIIWYQLDLTGDPTGKGRYKEKPDTVPAIVQRGVLFDQDPTTATPLFYFLPAIMTNQFHDLFIGTSVCGKNAYTNIAIAGRAKSDPPGTLRGPVLVTNNTTNPYNFGPLYDYLIGGIGQRWGDESSMALDPDSKNVWYTGEYAGTQNFWTAQAIEIKPFEE